MNNPTYAQLMRVGELQEIIRYAENRMREPKQDPFSGILCCTTDPKISRQLW